jgi:superfamily II DNA or RNA helicase
MKIIVFFLICVFSSFGFSMELNPKDFIFTPLSQPQNNANDFCSRPCNLDQVDQDKRIEQFFDMALAQAMTGQTWILSKSIRNNESQNLLKIDNNISKQKAEVLFEMVQLTNLIFFKLNQYCPMAHSKHSFKLLCNSVSLWHTSETYGKDISNIEWKRKFIIDLLMMESDELFNCFHNIFSSGKSLHFLAVASRLKIAKDDHDENATDFNNFHAVKNNSSISNTSDNKFSPIGPEISEQPCVLGTNYQPLVASVENNKSLISDNSSIEEPSANLVNLFNRMVSNNAFVDFQIEERGNKICSNFFCHKKYMKETFLTGNNFRTYKEAPWVNDVYLTFKQVQTYSDTSSISAISLQSKYFKAKYLTKNPQNINSQNTRRTFILAGRGEEALIPEEEGDGRIILVHPASIGLAKAKSFVGEKIDVFLVEEIGNIKEEDLGSVTSRRTGIRFLEYIWRVKHSMELDDNLKKLYLAKQYFDQNNQEPSWAIVYDIFARFSKKNKIYLLSARQFRKTHIKPPDTNNFKKDDPALVMLHKPGAKIFFRRPQKLIKKIAQTDQPVSVVEEIILKLYPKNPQFTMEDIFHQLASNNLGLIIATFRRELMFFDRAKTGQKDICVGKFFAEDWLSDQIRQIYRTDPFTFLQRTYDSLCKIILNTKNELRKNTDRVKSINLAQVITNIKRKRNQIESENKDLDIYNVNSNVATKSYKKYKKEDKNLTILPVKMPDRMSDIEKFKLVLNNFIVEYKRKRPSDSKLFPHQETAIYNLYEKFSNQLMLFKMATGTGKTTILMLLASLALRVERKNKPNHIAIITPRLVLTEQIYQEAQALNERIGDPRYRIDSKNDLVIVSSNYFSGRTIGHMNDFNQNKNKIFIFCIESFKCFIKSTPDKLVNFFMFLFDEVHLAQKLINPSFKQMAEENQAVVALFSATPSNAIKNISQEIINFDIKEGVINGILSPWIFDTPFDERDEEKFKKILPDVLTSLPHPANGEPLLNLKGIIFVNGGTKDADLLANDLKQRLGSDKIFPFHSLIKPKMKNNILNYFKNSDRVNLLIAVDMLRLGFDGSVDYIIDMRPKESLRNMRQVVGRSVRTCGNHRKIAYILTYKANAFDERGSNKNLRLTNSEWQQNNNYEHFKASFTAFGSGFLEARKKLFAQ